MLCYQLCSTRYAAVQINNCFKKNFCNQSSHYEKLQMISVTNGSHHVPTTKSTLFVVNKDEWYTREGRGKSMKNALYVQRYGKRHLSG